MFLRRELISHPLIENYHKKFAFSAQTCQFQIKPEKFLEMCPITDGVFLLNEIPHKWSLITR